MASVFDRVKTVVIDRLEVDESKVTITKASSFIDDLGADSLDTYELLQGLEEEFSISLAEDEAQNFKTIGHVVEYIEKLQ